jgi:hypothetical protein
VFNPAIACFQAARSSFSIAFTIAHDKGKPVVRQGRKAWSLDGPIFRAVKKVWLPKAIEEQPNPFVQNLGWKPFGIVCFEPLNRSVFFPFLSLTM